MSGMRVMILGVAVFGLAAACSAPKVPPAFTEEYVEAQEYVLEASDLVFVRVYKNPELSIEAPILPDGTITLPLAGRVQAEGLTTTDLEDLVSERLTEYIAAPEVTVTVRQVFSHRIAVFGEVQRPGMQPVASEVHVMDALAAAGGFTAFANKKKVKVIRRTPEGDVEFRFHYPKYVAGKAPGTNVVLRPGDVVVVPD